MRRCTSNTRPTIAVAALLHAGADPPPNCTTAAPQDGILQTPPQPTHITTMSLHAPPRTTSKILCVIGLPHARKGFVLITLSGSMMLVRLAKHPAHTSDGVRMSTACVAQQPYIDIHVTFVVRHAPSRQSCKRRLGHDHRTTKQASGTRRTRALANQANIATCILHTMF
jgi:hypothetical protein